MRIRKSVQETTTQYDARVATEFARIKERIDHFFVDMETDCPYGLPRMARFHQAYFAPLDQHVMELFLAAGYRRNGNCLYVMRCHECSACQSIRLQPQFFTPNRNQKRAWNKNLDIDLFMEPLEATDENIALCDRFLRSRYAKENDAVRYYSEFFENSIVSSTQIQYRLEERLVGSSIIDFGTNWLNAVYFFFDPEEEKRSLGTFNILTLIELCRSRGIEYLYLGYYIHGVRAMDYKKNFRPYQLYVAEQWETEK